MQGNKLKSVRSRLGLTQAQVADELGVAPNTVARWERGHIRMPEWQVERLEQLAEAGPSGTAISSEQGTIIDPHHKAILEALNDKLDPDVFESCAVELVRQDGRSVVHVTGGKDDGFDGAVADGDGEPFPLIVTTSTELSRNLRNSLTQTRRTGWKRDRAIFATSRRITPQVRRNLFEVARKMGVALVQAYDQGWFAHSLYRNPHWCKRLLGLSGRPHALSSFPKTSRHVMGVHVFGRETDLQWLISRKGDCLLVGGPGSGKTFLLRSLVMEGQALFLVDGDLEQIANDLRELRPSAVIIDDAHAYPNLLESFAHLRQEIGAERVPIIATSWSGDAERVKRKLNLASDNVRQLNLIDADTMVEIIKSLGITGPTDLIRIIREQADGRPGLAATLTSLYLKGDRWQVASGETLVNELASQLSGALDFNAKRLLAPFALGGDAGVDKTRVAELCGMSDFEISDKLAQLADAGVLRERLKGALSVEPTQMRWALVRDVFFDGEARLDYAPFLEIVQDREGALRTLVGAHSRGAVIPDLTHHMEQLASPSVWSDFASLGPSETNYILSNHPELSPDIARSGLLHSPEAMIPRLLDNVRLEEYEQRIQREGPMKDIEHWATQVDPARDDVLFRRSVLARAVHTWHRRTRKSRIAVSAMCVALQPGFGFFTYDPGAGRTLTTSYGILPESTIIGLTGIWQVAMGIVRASSDVPWNEIYDLVIAWRFGHPNVELNEKTGVKMQEFADRMVKDLTDATREHPGIQHRLQTLANRIGCEIDLSLDPDFEAIYSVSPSDPIEHWEACANKLAERWAECSIEEIAESLARTESEARLAGMDRTIGLARAACGKLAKRTSDPIGFAVTFMRYQLADGVVEPFLGKAISKNSSAGTSLLRKCLNEEQYEGAAVSVIVTHPDPARELIPAFLERAGEWPAIIDTQCRWGRVPDTTLEAILGAENFHLAFATAIGHWCAEPRGHIDEHLYASWRHAILRSACEEMAGQDHYYWLGEILSSDGDLSADWLLAGRGHERPLFNLMMNEELAQSATDALDRKQRRRVLMALPGDAIWIPDRIVQRLVGDDSDLYRTLLESASHARYHLSPLGGMPDRVWAAKAAAAVYAGYSVEKVVTAVLASPRSWMGDESKMCEEWRLAFEGLGEVERADSIISQIAIRGAEMMEKEKQAALIRERDEAVRGWQ